MEQVKLLFEKAIPLTEEVLSVKPVKTTYFNKQLEVGNKCILAMIMDKIFVNENGEIESRMELAQLVESELDNLNYLGGTDNLPQFELKNLPSIEDSDIWKKINV